MGVFSFFRGSKSDKATEHQAQVKSANERHRIELRQRRRGDEIASKRSSGQSSNGLDEQAIRERRHQLELEREEEELRREQIEREERDRDRVDRMRQDWQDWQR